MEFACWIQPFCLSSAAYQAHLKGSGWTLEQVRSLVEESMTQLLTRLPSLTGGGHPSGPPVQGPNVSATPSGSDGQTHGSGPGPMHLNGTYSDGHPSWSFTVPVNVPQHVIVNNMADASMRLEKIPEYKGDRKNDAAALWLMKAETNLVNHEECAHQQYTDRQRLVLTSQAFKIGTEAEAWWQLDQSAALERGR
ncbi:hypothetical protein LTR93_011172 [Exophiala xenobiotica]|nr:hypothetical protein LTR93_011172 [Exophiala xenobiotica]